MSDNSFLIFFNNQHSSVFMNKLQCQRKAGLFCDVILHVGSHTYAAHKNLLAASSIYFESMFVKELSNDKKCPVELTPFHITVCTVSVSPLTFCAILDYIYLGHISFESISAADVMMLANEFCLDSLKDYCHTYLQQQLSSDPSLPDTRSIDNELEHGSITKTNNPCNSFQELLKYEIKSEDDYLKSNSTNNSKIRQKVKRLLNIRPRHMCKQLEEDINDVTVTDVKCKRVKSNGTMITANNIDPECLVEPPQTDNQNGKSKCVKTKVFKGENNILQESNCEKPSAKIIRPIKIKNNNLKMKLLSRKSKFQCQSSEKAASMEEKTDADYKPDLEVFDNVDIVDTQQNSKPFKSTSKRKESQSEFKNRRRSRSKKESAGNRTVTTLLRCSPTFSCFWCEFTCMWSREMIAHVRALHFPAPPYKCDKCIRTTDGLVQFLRHRKIHVEPEVPLECPTCNKRFNIKSSLTQHLLCHIGEKAHTCPVCGHTFTTKAMLDQHIVMHSDHRPYLCHLCGFATKHQSLLIEHRRKHNGDMFRCDMPNCEYSTTRRNALARHMCSHLKIRQHVCSRCAQAFVQKSHLIRHERLHLVTRPYKCDRCPFDCNRPEYLKIHQRKCCLDEMLNCDKLDIDEKS